MDILNVTATSLGAWICLMCQGLWDFLWHICIFFLTAIPFVMEQHVNAYYTVMTNISK